MINYNHRFAARLCEYAAFEADRLMHSQPEKYSTFAFTERNKNLMALLPPAAVGFANERAWASVLRDEDVEVNIDRRDPVSDLFTNLGVDFQVKFASQNSLGTFSITNPNPNAIHLITLAPYGWFNVSNSVDYRPLHMALVTPSEMSSMLSKATGTTLNVPNFLQGSYKSSCIAAPIADLATPVADGVGALFDLIREFK